MIPFNIIVAIDSQNGIGKNGALPWHLPGDLKHFKKLTTTTNSATRQNAVIMGRKTWESIPKDYRPLVKRLNVVLTHQKDFSVPENVLLLNDFTSALTLLAQKIKEGEVENVYVIGGQKVFEQAIKSSHCQKLFVTHIQQNSDCDAFFPDFSGSFSQSEISPQIKENSITYYFAEYARKS